jgi:hypothetical protein
MTKEKAIKKKKSIWKRWWFWVIIVIVVGSIATSGSDDSTSDKITDEKSTTASSDKSGEELYEDIKSDVEEKDAKEAEPVKVWEGNGVVIYYKGVTSEGVKYLVENNTDKSITIQADSVAVNGFSANDIMMSDDISPQSKGYANAITSDLADAGTPETVSGSLNVIDSDSFNTIANAQFTNVPVNK